MPHSPSQGREWGDEPFSILPVLPSNTNEPTWLQMRHNSPQITRVPCGLTCPCGLPLLVDSLGGLKLGRNAVSTGHQQQADWHSNPKWPACPCGVSQRPKHDEGMRNYLEAVLTLTATYKYIGRYSGVFLVCSYVRNALTKLCPKSRQLGTDLLTFSRPPFSLRLGRGSLSRIFQKPPVHDWALKSGGSPLSLASHPPSRH